MREILFRGKRKDNGEWIASGNIIRFNPENGEDPVFIPGINEKCTSTHDEFDNIIAFNEAAFYKVNPETVGQFTGLTDKNGKKIFEGDIIQHGKRKGQIFYYGNFGMFMISWIPNGGANIFMNVLHTEVEVIGNTHDNPELLGGDNDVF